MKKILSVMLALALVLSSFIFTGVTAAAAGGDITDGLTWSFDENTGLLTISGTGEIPDYGDIGEFDMPWGDYAFNVKSLVIGEGVTRIGSGAFAVFVMLESVSFPSTLKSIGEYAFAYCAKLESVTLDGIEEIGAYAFMGCSGEACAYDLGFDVPEERTGLEYVTINGSEAVIGEGAFMTCFELDSVKLDGVLEIKESAFAFSSSFGYAFISGFALPEEHSGLKHLEITGDGVRIRVGAFCLNTELTELEFDGVSVFEQEAFSYCINLKSIIFSKVERIESGAFVACSGAALNSVFGTDIFDETKGLTEISINGNNATLLDGSFSLNPMLKDITLNGIAYAEPGVFSETAYALNTENYKNGLLYYGDMLLDIITDATDQKNGSLTYSDILYTLFNEKIGSRFVVVPGTKSIIGGCFGNIEDYDVYIPADVETIYPDAFGNYGITIFGEEGSAAESYADEYDVPFKPAYIFSNDEMPVNYDENVIFFDGETEPSVLDCFFTSTGRTLEVNASSDYCRTGDTVTVKDGDTVKAVYTVAVKNDLNGDFICDVLDIALAETLMSGSREADGAQILAAKGSADYLTDYEITADDYQALVNNALA